MTETQKAQAPRLSARDRAWIAVVGVAVLVGGGIAFNNWRSAEAEEKQDTLDLTCAIQADEGVPLDPDC